MTLMEEERRRQVALAFQEQILRKVTREQAGAGGRCKDRGKGCDSRCEGYAGRGGRGG